MRTTFRTHLYACAAALPLLSLSTMAWAQAPAPSSSPAPAARESTQLQEVIVTASKTGAQALQKTPDAVSVTTGAQIQAGAINNIKDLALFIPNTSFAQQSNHAMIYIRGIGSSNVNPGSDPDVTTQVDGVYIARPVAQMSSFVDVERVEVLRGPQGTLYGRNAVGGTINVISRTPSNTPTGEVSVSGGNYGAIQAQAYVSGPLVADRLQASVAINYTRHDAYFENIAPGGHDVGQADDLSARAQLRWEPTSDVDATLRFDISNMHDYFESYSQPLARTVFPSLANTIVGSFKKVALDALQLNNGRDGGVSAEVNWRFSPGFNLKSITAYRKTYFHYSNDTDATELNLQFFRSSEHDEQISQEFNLQYQGDRFKGVAGLYLFHDDDSGLSAIDVPPSVIIPAAFSFHNQAQPAVESNSGAIFAQGTYSITPDISAVVGARYTKENKKFDQTFFRTSLNPPTLGNSFAGFPARYNLSQDYSAFTPKFGLNWQATPTALVYASVTKGYKSGGFNYAAMAPSAAKFGPEKVWSYEAGAKTEWLDHRLRLNATAFYYDYTNLQVSQMLAPGVVAIGNAATATNKGVEIEMVAKPTPSLQFTLNASLLDAKYKSYPGDTVPSVLNSYVHNAVCVGTACTIDASGNYLNNAPKFGAAAAIDYHRQLSGNNDFYWHVDYTWRERTYFDPSNVLIMSQGAYGLLNAHVGVTLPGDNWRLELYGKNLTDQGYLLSTSASGVVPEGLAGDPRTYGVRISYNW